MISSKQRIEELIGMYPGENYDELIRGDDADVFYHLSTLRHTLYSWYPFAGHERALVIADRYGALAAGMAERFAQTDILLNKGDDPAFIGQRLQGREGTAAVRELPRESYDCIIYIQKDLGEDPRKLLPELREHLKEDGVLLIGQGNRAGLLHLYGNQTEDTYTQQEYRAILEESGFPCVRAYYPLPSLSFAQEICSPEELSEAAGSERLNVLGQEAGISCAKASALMRRAASEELYPQMADHILWECRKTEGPQIVHVYITAERRPADAFATLVYSERVCKQAMYAEGITSLQEQCRNLVNLQEHGLHTVPCGYSENTLVMPRMETPLLAEVLSRSTREEILGHLDRLYAEILRSSAWTERDGEKYLQSGYIDMVPGNCFLAGDDYVFFDQEFIRKDCPASFIMYRAIRYTWQKYPQIMNVLTPEEAYARFHIDAGKEKQYTEAEDRFTAELRRVSLFPQIFGPAGTPEDTEKHRRIQAVELDLLKQFDRVCGENGLRYTAVFGTMLGAVRHHGMIPWDDDIDVAMPREDYEKLITLAPHVFPDPYFLQTPENDTECFYGGYMKLRNTNTSAKEWFNKGKTCCQGIWIDIFPLDHCGDEKEQKKQQRRVYFYQRLLYAKRYPLWADRMIDSDPKLLSLYYILADHIHDDALCAKLKKTCMKHAQSDTLTVFAVYYSWRGNHNRFPTEDMNNLIRIPFEDMTVPVPANYDAWLKQRYGSTYMAMPAAAERHPHHTAEYNPDHA